MLLSNLTPSQYSQLSKLLDESLELPPGEREAWLGKLARSEPLLAETLRVVLGSEGTDTSGAWRGRLDLLVAELAPALTPDETLVGRRFGAYRVLSLLGHGGMGSVWLAERADGLFTRQVALKLVQPGLMGRMMTERLAREREILASLDHPNIARLLDAGFADDGQPYLALEYVSGTPLTTFCNDHRLSIGERLELFRQALRAVQYAHAHLVIHRDLKPSNMLVTPEGQVQLLDFGIAKLMTEGETKETQLTQLGGRVMTVDYAAPEQIAGAPLSTAADVYALGVTLYELLTGQRPYRPKRDTRGALEEAILSADPVPPSRVELSEEVADARDTTAKKLSSLLKGDLDTIVMKALKKSPAERYPTVAALDEDIARFLRGDVVLAQPDRAAYRALKFVRRHWVGLAVAASLILTLAVGLAVATYEARVAATQRNAALQAQLRSLMQTAAARLHEGDVAGAMGIALEVLPRGGATRRYTPEALNVFQEARAADAQVLVIPTHTQVWFASFSPDGRRIVASLNDNTARVWDAASGRELLRLTGHTDHPWSAVFSPDGQRIVTGSSDNTARVWDADTGRELLRIAGHAGRVQRATFSPDGRRIVTASRDGTAGIWDAETGREFRRLRGHSDRVTAAVYSPDGRQIATASADGTARIWDAESGRVVVHLNGHTSGVISVAYSPDGRYIVTASDDATARIWDTSSGREVLRLIGHTNSVQSAAFSHDGRRVVTASTDWTARIWDAVAGTQLELLRGHAERLVSAAFSPDEKSIVTASHDGTVRLWRSNPTPAVMQLEGHTDWVNRAVYSPNGAQVLTASGDKTARVWDAATGRETLRLVGHTDRVFDAQFSPDGRRIVTGSTDRSARIWDAASGRELARLIGHTVWVTSAVFSHDGLRVLTASEDKSARIWDIATLRQLARLEHSGPIEGAVFSPDDRRAVTAMADGTARIWDVTTHRELVALRGHTDRVWTATFSPDGRSVVTASSDHTARIWDANGHELRRLQGHEDTVNSAVFSPDGTRVATAANDGTVRLWDAATGDQLAVLGKLTRSIGSVAFAPDGQRIVTGSDDKTARVFATRTESLDAQIDWAAAAQLDPLSRDQRFQLGLPPPPDQRSWPASPTKCDEAAAAPYDPERRAPGVSLGRIAPDLAMAACAGKEGSSSEDGRQLYQRGRVQMASGKLVAAKGSFEQALERRYPAARVELAQLLSQASYGMLDLRRAISLYEQAFDDGVTIAGFELGGLYERGVSDDAHDLSSSRYALVPDESRAWGWYQRAADAGDPNALGRFAKREADLAYASTDAAQRKLHWLASFHFYAAAAERARMEDWPDDAWRDWRYRRASLARGLAQAGMMQEVAGEYARVRARYVSRYPRLTRASAPAKPAA